MPLTIRTCAMLSAASMALALGLTQTAANADEAKTVKPPLAVTCTFKPGAGDPETTLVLHLAAYDPDGTGYYRVLSAQLTEVIVNPDGSIASERNPCLGNVTRFE